MLNLYFLSRQNLILQDSFESLILFLLASQNPAVELKVSVFFPGRLAVRNKEAIPRPVAQVSPRQRRRRGNVHANRQSLRRVRAFVQAGLYLLMSNPEINE